MPALNVIDLDIDSKAHSYARVYSSLIEDEYQRKRAYASLVSLFALANVIEKKNDSVQKSMTLFKQPKLNEEYEIADFYVNNWHIDVRVFVDGDAVLFPKKHFDNNILPDFYAVVKVDKSLNNASLLGFIDPKTVNKQVLDYHYYSATIDELISYSDFISKVEVQKVVDFAEEEHQKFKEKYLTMLDEELDAETKSSLLRHMFACSVCRTDFCCFTGFEMVSCNMGKYPDLMEDQTLGIIGATEVDNPKYAGKEEIISIVDDEEEPEKEQSQDLLTKDNSEENSQEEKEDFSTQKDVIEELEESTDELLIENGDFEQIQYDEDNQEIVEYEKPTTIVEEYDEIVENEVETLEDDEEWASQMPVVSSLNINEQKVEEDDALAEESEETVSDILDELFNTDEDDYEYEDIDVQEKSVVVEPQQQEIVEEENYSDDEKNDDYREDEIESLDFYLPIDNKLSQESENYGYSQEASSDLEIYEDETQKINDKEEIESIDFQNVIVDYDEMGNPVYSYITDIPETTIIEEDSSISDNNESIEIIEDNQNLNANEDLDNYDILDEQYQTYMATNHKQEEPFEDVQSYNTSEIEEIELINDDRENYSDESIDYVEDSYDGIQEQKQEIVQDEYEEPYQESYQEEESGYDVDEMNVEENSVFDDENYVDETDESLPEERVAANNPILALVVSLALLATSAFGGYKLYQVFSSSDKTEKVESISDALTELNTEDMLAKTPQIDSEVEKEISKEESKQVEVTDFVKQEDKTASVSDIDNLPKLPSATPSDENYTMPSLLERDLLSPKQNSANINKSMASAFSVNSTPATVKNINWLCTPQLFTDSAFKAFLQDIDGLLKMNMRKNILNATESPKNLLVSVKMAIDNNGKIEKIMISESSGSEQIDNIVLQSINESLTGKKSPILKDGKLKADRYHLKVVIKL